MELNKKTILQLTLILVGILLVFFIYFYGSNKDSETITSSNISDIEKKDKSLENRNIFENLEYKGTDNNGNKFVIFTEYSDFETDKPEIINMENVLCYFYFKDETVLEIRSQKGTYNNVSLDIKFAENVNMFYKERSLFSDLAEFNNSSSSLHVEGNVKTIGPNGDLMADRLNFDFLDKKLKVSMYNEDRVNIKTKLR
tara:strand:- start:2125 stop:2718 length:594 start_codon:yes stop_codon:yes gene_type:complete